MLELVNPVFVVLYFKVTVMSTPVQEVEPERTREEEQKDISFIKMSSEPNPSLPRAIILDLSPVNFLDTVGVKTIRRVRI